MKKRDIEDRNVGLSDLDDVLLAKNAVKYSVDGAIQRFYKLQITDSLSLFEMDGDFARKICKEIGRFFVNFPPLEEDRNKIISALECHPAMMTENNFIKGRKEQNQKMISDAIAEGEAIGAFPDNEIPSCFIVPPAKNPTAKDTVTIPPFPLDTLPASLAEAVEAIAISKGVSNGIVFGYILSLASACLGRCRVVEYISTEPSKDEDTTSRWREIPNLFTLIVGETGSGKSQVYKQVFRHLNRIDAANNKKYTEWRKGYEADMAVWKKSKEQKPEDKPKREPNIQYFVEDGTIEAISDLLVDNPRGLLWYQDEMSYFWDRLDRYNSKGSNAKSRILSCYDSSAWKVTRKTKDGESQDKFFESVTLSLVGGIQPEMIPTIFSPQDIAQGIPQRFIFFYENNDVPRRLPAPGVPKHVTKLIEKITDRLLGVHMLSGAVEKSTVSRDVIVEVSGAAAGEFEDFHNMIIEQGAKKPIKKYLPKLVANTLRVALLMHYLYSICDDTETATKIHQNTMVQTIKIMEWLLLNTEKSMGIQPCNIGSDFPMPDDLRLDALKKCYENNRELFESGQKFSDICKLGGLDFRIFAESQRAAAMKFSEWAKGVGIEIKTGADTKYLVGKFFKGVEPVEPQK